MTSNPQVESDSSRERHALRRRSLLHIAGVVAAFGVVDVLRAGKIPWAAFAIRACWALFMVVMALRLPNDDAAFVRVARKITWVSVPALTAITFFTGGVTAVLIITFPAIPLIVVLFTDPRAAGLTTLLCVAAVAFLTATGGLPLATVVGWCLVVALLGATAVVGGQHLMRTQALTVRAEWQRAEAERAKADALARLASTERRAAHAERLAMVGSLASGVAHEINNPLAFAKSSARYLEQRFADASDEEALQAFEDVNVGMERIEQIVRDLRHFSREDRERMTTVSVRTLVEEAVRIASVRFRGLLQVGVDVAQHLPPVETSPGRVVQILVNLLVNAADALESADPRPAAARVAVSAYVRDGWLELAVEDTGPGLAPDVLPKLFQPFFTTKPPGKGTGLGLAVSLEYCVRLGGTLVAENKPEGGARFIARLPLHPAATCSEVRLAAS